MRCFLCNVVVLFFVGDVYEVYGGYVFLCIVVDGLLVFVVNLLGVKNDR